MRVHVLIVNWNGWRDTVECLESVFQSRGAELRVVVCDNASRDDSLRQIMAWADERAIAHVEYARAEAERGGDAALDAPLTLIQTGANLGFAGANNVALRYTLARGDAGFVWLLNNDTVVAPDALTEMLRCAADDERRAAVGAKLLYYHEPGRIQAMGGGQVWRWNGMSRHLSQIPAERSGARGAHGTRLDYITGACMLVRCSAVERVGLMDERYFLYSEEVDWCVRMREAGFLLACCASAEVRHKEGQSVGRSTVHDYYTTRSALLFVHKFHPRLLPVALLYSVYRCALPKVARAQWSRLRAVARSYRDFARVLARGTFRRETYLAGGPS